MWQIVTYANLNNYIGLGAYRLILCYNSTKKKKSSISKKLSKPKIWRANPQKCALTVSLIYCSLAKFWLLMKSSSLGLMTYCSLAKKFMEIKKFNTPIKIFNFCSTIATTTTQPFQIFSLSNISKLNHNQNTNSNHNLKTNQIKTKNEKTKQNKTNQKTKTKQI